MIDRELARAMRGNGLTLEEVGQELGVTRERIRQVTVDVEPQRACKECGKSFGPRVHGGRTYCSSKCQRRGYAASIYGRCECGNPKSKRSDKCLECRRRQWEEDRHDRWHRMEFMWSEGLPIKEIANRLGTTPNAFNVDLHRARKAGFNLPLRRARVAKAGTLTKAGCRGQFVQALRTGTIRRATRCEECGETGGLIEGHHHDYNRPLYVTWVCRACHVREHGKTPIAEAVAA